MEVIKEKKRLTFVSGTIAVVTIIASIIWYMYRVSEITRLKEFEIKMRPYINYDMSVCTVMNKYMEYLRGIDDTTKTFLMYEKSINELQKQNPKYDILAIDAFLRKVKPE